MNSDQTDLSPQCLQYRLPLKELSIKVVAGRKRVSFINLY